MNDHAMQDSLRSQISKLEAKLDDVARFDEDALRVELRKLRRDAGHFETAITEVDTMDSATMRRWVVDHYRNALADTQIRLAQCRSRLGELADAPKPQPATEPTT